MKKLLSVSIISAASLAIVPQASAQQLTDPSFDWTGFYAGLHVGGTAVGHATNVDPGGIYAEPIIGVGEGAGISGGGQVGYRHDFGALVAGIELSGSFGDVTSSGTMSYNLFGPPLTDINESVTLGSRGRLVATLGFEPVEGWLISVDGGGAIAHITTSGEVNDPILGVLDTYGGSGVVFGPTAGLRTDVALNESVSIFASANISYFGDIPSEWNAAPFDAPSTHVVPIEVKAGVNWHF